MAAWVVLSYSVCLECTASFLCFVHSVNHDIFKRRIFTKIAEFCTLKHIRPALILELYELIGKCIAEASCKTTAQMRMTVVAVSAFSV